MPAPFRPMTPSTCPSGTWNETSLERPDLRRRTVVLATREPSPRVHQRLAQRPVGGLVLAETVLLGERVDLDRDRHQIVSAKRGSDERNDGEPDDEEHERDGDADGDLAHVGLRSRRARPSATRRSRRSSG